MDMISSPEDSSDTEITTPVNQTANAAAPVPSPPDSQRQPMPTVPSGASIANSNGKRPLQTISNGADDTEGVTELRLACAALGVYEDMRLMGTAEMANANGKSKAEAFFKTHASSGYTYSRPEDEPGYAWLNKKTQDEITRALEGLQHKDCMLQSMLQTT